jgi:hypothetical protein
MKEWAVYVIRLKEKILMKILKLLKNLEREVLELYI